MMIVQIKHGDRNDLQRRISCRDQDHVISCRRPQAMSKDESGLGMTACTIDLTMCLVL